jgi:hypothetical protein
MGRFGAQLLEFFARVKRVGLHVAFPAFVFLSGANRSKMPP